tara:strand:+ start:142 stop:558 length:417 start_codon:yes stop_codon:yes gene_type:complete
MAVKDLIGPAFVGTNTVKYIVTRGMTTTQSVVPIIAQSNTLIGDIATEDRYRKGLALTGLTFVLVNKSTGAAITSGSVTTKITKDGGTQGTTTNSAAHEGNGQWSINLTAAEMDADIVGLAMTHTNALTLYVTLKTSL